MRALQTQSTAKLNRFILGAVAEKEIFQDVHTITLKGEFMKNLEIDAVDHVMASGKKLTQSAVRAEMSKLVNAGIYMVQESVHCTSKGMFVVVNADAINDDAVDAVFKMVSEALEVLDGGNGVIKFNQPVTFTLADIPWINLH